MAIKSLSIRIDEKMLHKLHVVADYEGRSANSEILILFVMLLRNTKKNTVKLKLINKKLLVKPGSI